jgi:hypothetical protein
MSTSKEETWENIKAFLGDVRREAVQTYINDKVEAALVIERKREIQRATAALYEAKVEVKLIIQLLQDHWNINKSQATEALRVEKTVRSPMKVLRTYLQSQGYGNNDAIEFLKKNFVKQQLENDPSLWKLSNSPAKLMKVVKENKSI